MNQAQTMPVVDELTSVQSTEIDEVALAMHLREQSPAGLALLYDRYGRLVYSVALRITGDHGAAEEITQDVFLRCWNNGRRYDPSQGSLTSWLLAIVHHRAVDELRSRRGKARRSELSVDEMHYLATHDPALDEALLRDEVRATLAMLPEVQRETIELIYWGGLSRREVAERLGIPLGTVHTRLRLGIDKLRVAFHRLFSDE